MISLIIIALVEANALVGSQGATKKPLDSISGTVTAGAVLWAVLVLVIRVTLH